MTDIQRRAQRLVHPDLSSQERLDDISDLRERIEVFHHPKDYSACLELLFPAFERILNDLVPPSFRSGDINHKIRIKVMEILNRLPINDIFARYAPRMYALCLRVIERDNEESSLIAMRIMFELQRTLSNILENESHQFLDLVQQMYGSFDSIIATVFSETSLAQGTDRIAPPESEGPYNLLRGVQSFQVMVEAPVIIMVILNIDSSSARMVALIPLLFKVLAARLPRSILDQKLEAKTLRVRQFRFENMLLCQLKVLSFLTYGLGNHLNLLNGHEPELTYHVQNMLQITPAECIGLRRELLVATRHILQKTSAKLMFPYLNVLLDESVLLGKPGGRLDLATKPMPSAPLPAPNSAQTAPLNSAAGGVQNRLPTRRQPLVTLAYAALTDLISAVRSDLDIAQLTRVVYLYSRNVHDSSLPLSMQITCVRVLLNLVDRIYQLREPQPVMAAAQQSREFGAHGLLIKILDALARKLSTLRYLMKRVAIMDRINASHLNSAKSSDQLAQPLEWFLFVKPGPATQPGNDPAMPASSSVEPYQPPTLQRSISLSSNVSDSAGEVVRVDIQAGGHSGVRRRRASSSRSGEFSDHRELDRAFVLGIAAPYDSNAYHQDPTMTPPDTMKEVCNLIRNIVMGFKTIFYCLTNIDAPLPVSVQQVPPGHPPTRPVIPPPPQMPHGQQPSNVAHSFKGIAEEELRLVSKAFSWGLQCMVAFDSRINPDRNISDLESDETEVLEMLSNAFVVLDPSTFTDVMQDNIRFFYTCMLRHRKIARVATSFLKSASLARAFGSVLLPFVLARFSLIAGRFAPVNSTIDRYVDGLMPGKVGESDEVDEDRSWVMLSAPMSMTAPAQQYEATYFGGSTAASLKINKPLFSNVATESAAASFGSFTEDRVMVDAVFALQETFTPDEEAYMLFKLHRATITSLQTLTRPGSVSMQMPGSSGQNPSQQGLASLSAAYLEPTAYVCLAVAANTMCFPLEPLRRPITAPALVTKPEYEDVSENAIGCLKSMLSIVLEHAPEDVKDVLKPIITRLAKPIVRAANRLIAVATQDPSNALAMARADTLADLCLILSLTIDDWNSFPLPFSHALMAYKRGNDNLVTKALSYLDRLVPFGGFNRICVARGGPVIRALRNLVKYSYVHGAHAMRLQGKTSYDSTTHMFVPDEKEAPSKEQFLLNVPWKGASKVAELDLSGSVMEVRQYLEDTFAPPKPLPAVAANNSGTQSSSASKSDVGEQDLIDIHQKREAVDLIASVLRMSSIPQTQSLGESCEIELLVTYVTCVADNFVGDHSWTLLCEQISSRPLHLGRAVAHSFVKGCAHRARAAVRVMEHVEKVASVSVKKTFFEKGLIPTLLEEVQEKTWLARTGGLYALTMLLGTSTGRELVVANESQYFDFVLLSLIDYETEYGSDILFHAGTFIVSFLTSTEFKVSISTVEALVRTLATAEHAEVRRVLRGALHIILTKGPPEGSVTISNAVDRTLFGYQTTLLGDSISVMQVTARLELLLFCVEELSALQTKWLTNAGPMLRECYSRYKTVLGDDAEGSQLDSDSYTFTFQPVSVAFRVAFLRLARRICNKNGGEFETQFTPGDLSKLAATCLTSAWPVVSRSAQLLVRTLTRSLPFADSMEAIAKEQLSHFLEDPARGVGLSVNQVRGLDRLLSECRIQFPGLILPIFPQAIFAMMTERCDTVKIFAALSDRAQAGEEVHVPGALLELLKNVSSESFASIIEPAISHMAKFETQVHLFHFSNFPSTVVTSSVTGKPVNFRLIVGSNCGARLSSPLRTPISRLFATAPATALEQLFINDRLIKRTYSSLVCDLLRREMEGECLRRELVTNPRSLEVMSKATFEVTYEPPGMEVTPQNSKNYDQLLRRAQARVVELRFQGVRIIRSMIKWAPTILKNEHVLNNVIAVMKTPDREVKMAAEEKLPLRHRTLARIACKTVIAGFKAGAPVGALCEILPFTLLRSTTDTLFLSDFFSKHLRGQRRSVRNEIISAFTKVLIDPATSIPLREAILRLVIVPLLATGFIQKAIFAHLQKTNASSEVYISYGLDPRDSSSLNFPSEAFGALIDLVLSDRSSDRLAYPELYGPASPGEDLDVQILQLSTLLMAHSGKDFMEHRKSLIRHAWSHLSGEESPAKHWAYVNICTFIDVYHTPPDIILQIYVELLRAHATEARDLVCRALDLLAPALHKRMELGKYIKAIKWTKKLLFDDGHHLPQLTHVFQMVTHHPYMFYQYRAQFIPQMVMALSKISIPQSTPMENRELAVNVAELVLSWERTRETEEQRSGITEIISQTSVNREEVTRAYRLHYGLFGIISNFLIRIALQLVEGKDVRSKALSKRAVLLLKSCLDLARRRSDRPVLIIGTVITRAIQAQEKKQEALNEQELNQVRKILGDTGVGANMDNRGLPSPPWERRPEPGSMHCAMELLTTIVSVEGDIVAKSFLEKSAPDLPVIIEPLLGCFERDSTVTFAKLIFKLLQTNPINTKSSPLTEIPNAAEVRRDYHEERAGAFTGQATGQQAPPPPATAKAFYPALLAALHKRLVHAAEDSKKLEQNVMTAMGQGANGPLGNLPPAARGRSGVASTPDRNIPRIVQQRIAKEVAYRQSEFMSAGPRGILNVLRLLQVLCGSDDPSPFPNDPDICPSQYGFPPLTERFFSSLLKLAAKLTKEITTRTGSGANVQSGSTRVDFADDLSTIQRNKVLSIHTMDICLSLLAGTTMTPPDTRRNFVLMLITLLDKCEASDHILLRRVVKVGQSLFVKNSNFSAKERQTFWAKLMQLEQRMAGLPDTTKLIEDIHDLALSCPMAPARGALFAGTMAPNPRQRARFWALNFGSGGGTSPEQLGDLLAGRKEDIFALGNKFSLPIFLRFLLESRLMSVHDSDLFHLLSRVAFADGSGRVALQAWRECLTSVWSVSSDHERRSITELVHNLAIAAPLSVLGYYTARQAYESRRTAFLSMPALQGTMRIAQGIRRVERSYLMSRFGLLRTLILSVWNLGGARYADAAKIQLLGKAIAEDRSATMVALEDMLTATNQPETGEEQEQTSMVLMDEYSEGNDDEMVKGMLMVVASPTERSTLIEPGITLELGSRWGDALRFYVSESSATGSPTSGTENEVKSSKTTQRFIERATRARTLEDVKRLRLDWDDGWTTDEEEEGGHIPEPKTPSVVMARGLDLRMKACCAKLGQWRSVLEWAQMERDSRSVAEALSRRLDLAVRPLLSECRKRLPSFPHYGASVELACLELCAAIKHAPVIASSGSGHHMAAAELEDLYKRAMRTTLHSVACPSKGMSQRLVELDESLQCHLRLQRQAPEQRAGSLNQILTMWSQRPPTNAVTPEEFMSILSWRVEFVHAQGMSGLNPEPQTHIAYMWLQGARHARSRGLLELGLLYIEQALSTFNSQNKTQPLLYEIVLERARITLSLPSLSVQSLGGIYEDLEAVRKTSDRKDNLCEANRMRGRILALAGRDHAVVDEAFCLALQHEPSSSRTWLEWARTLADHAKSEAAVCVAKALSLGYTGGAKTLVPLLLDPEGGALDQLESINVSVFIPWVSTLLEHPCPFSKAALEKMVALEPQTLLHELSAIRPQQLGGTPKQCLEMIKKRHPELYAEFVAMKDLVSADNHALVMKWRPKVLRVPGTKRKLEYALVRRKQGIGRRVIRPRLDFYSDDGRSPSSFALHESALSDAKKRVLTLFYLAYEIVGHQDGAIAENLSSPSVFHLDETTFLERDLELTSLNHIVVSAGFAKATGDDSSSMALKHWFLKYSSDADVYVNARRRFTKQLAAHSVLTSLCPGVLVGAPSEILVGRGVETTFVVLGTDSEKEDAPTKPVPFRLTPNLETFMTVQGVFGPFAAGMGAVARCLTRIDARHALSVLLGEDKISSQDVLSEDATVRDSRVLAMIKEARDGARNESQNWMPWC